MAIYLVSYDLNQPGQDYPNVIKAIKTYEHHCQILKSQWLVCSHKMAEDIYNHLRKHIDDTDRLLVCEFTMNAEGWLSSRATDWLKEHR